MEFDKIGVTPIHGLFHNVQFMRMLPGRLVALNPQVFLIDLDFGSQTLLFQLHFKYRLFFQ